MDWLWTRGGTSFGYREVDDLWTPDGRHVGRFHGGEVYGPGGNYLGELEGSGLLVTNRAKTSKRANGFEPSPAQSGSGQRSGRAGLAMHGNYEDFPAPEKLS
jgi:hypothetical protein